jgi:addiction module RelE/StbE family toxin
MKNLFSPGVERYLRDVKKKDNKIFALLAKQLRLFESNPHHPPLRIHKLSGKLKNTWSLFVGRRLRMIYITENNANIFIDIGTHGEVYKK